MNPNNLSGGTNNRQPHEGASIRDQAALSVGGLMIPAGFVPGKNDIICGKAAKHHSGNRWCRTIIEVELQHFWEKTKEAKQKKKKKKKRKQDECNANRPAVTFTREEKASMVNQIMATIQRINPQTGGFVRVDQRSGRWIRVPDAQARKKILEIMLDVADCWGNAKAKDDSDSTVSDSATSFLNQNFLEQYVSKQSAHMQALLQEAHASKRPRIQDFNSSLSSDSHDRTASLRTNWSVAQALHLAPEQQHTTMNHSFLAEHHDVNLEPNHIPELPGDRASHIGVEHASSPPLPGASYPHPNGQIHEDLRLQNFLGVLEAAIPDSVVYNVDGSDPFEPNPFPG